MARRRRPAGQASLLNRFQQGSRQKRAADKFDYSYYDRIVMANGTSEFRMFQSPIGQNGKTMADTNMKNGGSIPNGTHFRAHALKVIYTGSSIKVTSQKLFAMLANTTLEIILDGKADLGTYTLAEIFGSPVNLSVDTAAAGNGDLKSMTVMKGILPLNYPIDLAALQNFEVKIRHWVAPDATLNGDWLQISFNGRSLRLS